MSSGTITLNVCEKGVGKDLKFVPFVTAGKEVKTIVTTANHEKRK